MQVVRIDDHGALPVPDAPGDYRDGGGRPYRDDLRPIEVTQPEGASFALDGYALTWGPVARAHRLQPARVADAARARVRRGRWRRAAADRAPALDRRARDPVCRHQSDRGLQERLRHRRVRPRRPTSTRSSSAATASARSATWTRSCTTATGARRRSATPSACTRRTPGILWKHFDWRSGATDVRRARRLVISSIVTVGNYEYGALLVPLAGRLDRLRVPSSPASCTPPAWGRGRSPSSATLVAPGVSAGYHQHFFCARLDLDIDGERNALSEVDSRPDPPGPANPHDQSFTVRETPLASELAAQRLIDPLSGRRWRVSNPGAQQPHGTGRRVRARAGRERRPDGRRRTPSSRAARAS